VTSARLTDETAKKGMPAVYPTLRTPGGPYFAHMLHFWHCAIIGGVNSFEFVARSTEVAC
jgi:hypothetical protein